MSVIFKYPLYYSEEDRAKLAAGGPSIVIVDEVEFELPIGFQPLRTRVIRGKPELWILHAEPKTAQKQRVKFKVFGTGHTIDDQGLEYVDTYFMLDGDAVFHVFMEVK